MKHLYIIEYDFDDENLTSYAVLHDDQNLREQALKDLQKNGGDSCEEIVDKNINSIWKIADEDVLEVARDLLDFSKN